MSRDAIPCVSPTGWFWLTHRRRKVLRLYTTDAGKKIVLSRRKAAIQINTSGNRARESHSGAECTQSLQAVQDALYVLNGKWKFPIIIALTGKPKRFGELQRLVTGITAKVLSKELKELEMNEFAVRHVYATMPVTVEYELTDYSQSLNSIIEALRSWGIQHRARILGKDRLAVT